MRGMFRRAVIGAATLAIVVGNVAATQPTSEPVPRELVSRTETLYIAAGCPQDTPGTCTSTRWLGKSPGDAQSNFITSITPVDEVNYQLGEVNWRDYPAHASQRESYLLDAERDGRVVVALTAQGPGVLTTLHVRVSGFDGDGTYVVLLDDQRTENLLPRATTEFEFVLDLDALAGTSVNSLQVDLAVHGVNVAAGYIDQAGGSFVELPWLEEVESS